ncbi:UNKNOWN [Stylonychia lemnae]|uniref:Uncharacterized protein n=1 Tax=Stylonychia lemnae TaxID=5949 RepID=A0A078AX92_STYLE|nr:UNKNOWN [Stylonychia lemnae]|eukprot:CDW86789.1 UNKNOWN [Stylonychia lemnae]
MNQKSQSILFTNKSNTKSSSKASNTLSTNKILTGKSISGRNDSGSQRKNIKIQNQSSIPNSHQINNQLSPPHFTNTIPTSTVNQQIKSKLAIPIKSIDNLTQFQRIQRTQNNNRLGRKTIKSPSSNQNGSNSRLNTQILTQVNMSPSHLERETELIEKNKRQSAVLPLSIKQPLSTRHKNQNNFFIASEEDAVALLEDREVQQVNDRAQEQNAVQDFQNLRKSAEIQTKRMSQNSKRGRNQPSQYPNNHSPIPQHFVVNTLAQQNLDPQQQEIMIVNLSKKEDSYYGNDMDIYEMERLGNVMLLNQVKLKEESSFSIVNDSQSIVNHDLRLRLDELQLQRGSDSIRNLSKQKSVNDLRIPMLFHTNTQPKLNPFAPIEQELDESVSRINESDFRKKHFLFQQRSLSLSSYHNMSKQQSHIMKHQNQNRPESGSLLQDFKSLSSGKIMRRDSSTGQLFESPSERTILDVLGLCSSSTQKHFGNHRDSGVMNSCAPFTAHCNMNLGQEVSEIFNVEGTNNQISLGGGNNGQVFLLQSQYQYLDYPSKMHSLIFMNQSNSSQNPQIIFNNYHTGQNGSQTGDSFSTNKIVNNFLDEKRKELEALQEVDRESDTTEQMTFSQNSRVNSQDSRNHDQKDLGDELIVEEFGLVDSKEDIDDQDDDQMDKDLEIQGSRRRLRRTSRIFEYYNKNKKDSMSKKKKKRRVATSNTNNMLMSGQSQTRGSNIQMMSIRDILVDKDSLIQQQQQLLMTPEELIQNKVDSSSLVELHNPKALVSHPKISRPQRTSRANQNQQFLLQNRKFSEHQNLNPSHTTYCLFSSSTPGSLLVNQNGHKFKKSQSKNHLTSEQKLLANTVNQKSRNNLFSQLHSSNPQLQQQQEQSPAGMQGFQSSRTTNNLVIDKRKNYLLKDNINPSATLEQAVQSRNKTLHVLEQIYQPLIDNELNRTGQEDVDLIELKLPSCLRIQPKEFDAKSYQVEDPIEYINDVILLTLLSLIQKGIPTDKVCAIEDIIRWRYVDPNDKDAVKFGKEPNFSELNAKMDLYTPNNKKIESNAKIVQWSDGTYSLAIGNELFEMSIENLTNRQSYAQFEKFHLFKGNVTKKIIVKPPPKSSRNQKRFIKRINEAQQKIQQANITMTGDSHVFKQYQKNKSANGNKPVSTNFTRERADSPEEEQVRGQTGAKRTLDQAHDQLEREYFDHPANKRQKLSINEAKVVHVEQLPKINDGGESGDDEDYYKTPNQIIKQPEALPLKSVEEEDDDSDSSSSNSSGSDSSDDDEEI